LFAFLAAGHFVMLSADFLVVSDSTPTGWLLTGLGIVFTLISALGEVLFHTHSLALFVDSVYRDNTKSTEFHRVHDTHDSAGSTESNRVEQQNIGQQSSNTSSQLNDSLFAAGERRLPSKSLSLETTRRATQEFKHQKRRAKSLSVRATQGGVNHFTNTAYDPALEDLHPYRAVV
jgi:hypothetical protein